MYLSRCKWISYTQNGWIDGILFVYQTFSWRFSVEVDWPKRSIEKEHHGLKRSECCCKKPWPLWDSTCVRAYLNPPRVWNFSPLTTKNRPGGWNLTPLECGGIYIFKGDIQGYIRCLRFFVAKLNTLTSHLGRSSCCVAGDLGTCTRGEGVGGS